MQNNPSPCETCERECTDSRAQQCPKWQSWFRGEWERTRSRTTNPPPRKKTIYDHERSFFVYENPNVTRQRMKDEAEQTKEDHNALEE